MSAISSAAPLFSELVPILGASGCRRSNDRELDMATQVPWYVVHTHAGGLAGLLSILGYVAHRFMGSAPSPA